MQVAIYWRQPAAVDQFLGIAREGFCGARWEKA